MPNKKKPGLYHTKHGQPYRILKNGKARFVKKTKSTRRKKGGSASVGGSARVGGGLKRRRKGGGVISSKIYNAAEPYMRHAISGLPF